MITELAKILMERDGLTVGEANEAVREAREMVSNGADPQQVLQEEFGLEPDYFMDLFA